jgi:hypothetical protein
MKGKPYSLVSADINSLLIPLPSGMLNARKSPARHSNDCVQLAKSSAVQYLFVA